VSLTALGLIIIAAFAHSTWNLLAKRAADCRHLIWFACCADSVIFLPVSLWIVHNDWQKLGWKAAAFLLATGVLHLVYFDSLQRGYRAGDLSVVYPLARGTGPLLSFWGAVLVLRERPTALAFAGALLVVSGILLLSGGLNLLRSSGARAGIFWGALTGVIIACYTIVDGYSVKVLLLSPILVDFAENIFRAVVLTPRACQDRARVRAEFSTYWKHALGIAFLTPTGYILVLFAMKIAPVSHIAPAREMSMMIGAYFGSKVLSEGHLLRRMIASALIAGGIFGLVLG
jgi:uncharacterized membrane protein